jgi:hypothetical protein
MQAPRMLPLLISPLAMAMCLLAADCICGIIMTDFDMLAEEHFIIAEAGVTAKVHAIAESSAAVVNVLI